MTRSKTSVAAQSESIERKLSLLELFTKRSDFLSEGIEATHSFEGRIDRWTGVIEFLLASRRGIFARLSGAFRGGRPFFFFSFYKDRNHFLVPRDPPFSPLYIYLASENRVISPVPRSRTVNFSKWKYSLSRCTSRES